MRAHGFLGAVFVVVFVSALNTLSPLVQGVGLLLASLSILYIRGARLAGPGGQMLAVGAIASLVFLTTAIAGDPGSSFRLLRPLIEGWVAGCCLYRFVGISQPREMSRVLAWALFIQLAIAFFMLSAQEWRLSYMESLYAESLEDVQQLAGAALIRGYGLTRHHFYGFPLFCGLCAALLLYQASLSERLSERVFLSCASLAGMILASGNARIGLLPPLLLLVTHIAASERRVFFAKFLVTATLAVLSLGACALILVPDLPLEATFDWLAAGVLQLSDDSRSSSTFGDLWQMISLPTDVSSWVVGSRVCGIDDACYSDIGFIRALQEGGLPLVFMLAVAWGGLHLSVARYWTNGRTQSALLATVLLVSFAASMVKGEAYGTSDYSRFVAMMATLAALTRQAHRTENKPVTS